MAHGHKSNESGSQFFITLGRQKFLDGKYTVIGQVKDRGSKNFLREIENSVKTDHEEVGGRCGVDHTDRPKEPLVMKDVSLIGKEKYEKVTAENESDQNQSSDANINIPESTGKNDSSSSNDEKTDR